MSKRHFIIYLVLLLIAVIPVSAQAQQKARVYTVSFDGISLTLNTDIGENLTVKYTAGDPVESAGPGFSDATSLTFQPYSGDYPALTHSPFPANIRFYRTADLAQYDFMQEVVKELDTMLETQPDLSNYYTFDNRLPYLPILTHGQVIRARANYLDAQEVHGITYITAIMAAAEPFMNNTFFYTFQGLSKDGAYYISADFMVTIDLFPAEIDTSFDPAAFMDNLDAYLAESSAAITEANDAVFTPHLTLFDAVIQSIAFGK